jgi:hypothetical protein
MIEDKPMKTTPCPFKRGVRHLTLLLSILFTIFAPVGINLLAANPVQAAAASSTWYDDVTQYSSILNCASIIQGFPYYENGMAVYTGFLADPLAMKPGIGLVYYVQVVVGMKYHHRKQQPAGQLWHQPSEDGPIPWP